MSEEVPGFGRGADMFWRGLRFMAFFFFCGGGGGGMDFGSRGLQDGRRVQGVGM